MPIVFSCPSCQGRLRVPDDCGGKRIRCPRCSHVCSADEQSALLHAGAEAGADTSTSPVRTADASATGGGAAVGTSSGFGPSESANPLQVGQDAISTGDGGNGQQSSPLDAWKMKTDDGRQYGPVSKAELDGWVREGRVSQRCQLYQEGQDRWQWAAEIYPQLATAAPINAYPGQSAVGYETQAVATSHYAGAPANSTYYASPYQPGGVGSQAGGYSSRSKIAAGLLGIFLGVFGVHRFYLGFIGLGFLQLILGLVTCGAVSQIWGLIEGILLLTGSMDRDADGRLLRD